VQKKLSSPPPTQFQSQIEKLYEQISEEIEDWREQITWEEHEGKAIRVNPPLPQEQDEDLQVVRNAIWTREMRMYQITDELEQQNRDDTAHLKWAINPEKLTWQALWDEYVFFEDRTLPRLQEIRDEIYGRYEVHTWEDVEKLSDEQCSQISQSIRIWFKRYGKYRDGIPTTTQSQESIQAVVSKRIQDLYGERCRQTKEEPITIIYVLSGEKYEWMIKQSEFWPGSNWARTASAQDAREWLEK
jgi:hypothetical protein